MTPNSASELLLWVKLLPLSRLTYSNPHSALHVALLHIKPDDVPSRYPVTDVG
jgi:hypothetical protein